MNRINHGGRSKRRVTRITEIKKETQIGFNERENRLQEASQFTFCDIFLRDPIIDRLICSYNSLSELYMNSDIINKINLLRGEYISENNFVPLIKGIQSVLSNFLRKKIPNMGELINTFHNFWKSSGSYKDLKDIKNVV